MHDQRLAEIEARAKSMERVRSGALLEGCPAEPAWEKPSECVTLDLSSEGAVEMLSLESLRRTAFHQEAPITILALAAELRCLRAAVRSTLEEGVRTLEEARERGEVDVVAVLEDTLAKLSLCLEETPKPEAQ